MENWKDELQEAMPLLGHRNWIVVADMAYPLQAQAGITTLYANADYFAVVEHVYKTIDGEKHVKPLIYNDQELAAMDDSDAVGVGAFKANMQALLGSKIRYLPHDAIIARLDQVSKMFNVLIIKTPLTIPYTSTFFELDCGYWTAEQEQKLRAKIK